MAKYTELFNKAQKELELVRAQKVQVQTKIEALVEELGLDKDESLQDQIESFQKSLESSKNEYLTKLNELESKLNELESNEL